MSAFASKMQAVALKLLTKYGGSVTGVRHVISGYNPSDSSVTLSSDITYSGVGNASPYTVGELIGANGTVSSQDLKMLFSCTTRPAIDDLITTDNKTYRVMSVEIANVNETDVVYTLQLRN